MKFTKQKKKLIILVTHELFMPDFAGGGEKIVYEYTKRLAERGHDVTVLTTGDPKIKTYNGIKTMRLPVNRYLFNLAAIPWILKYGKNADIIQTNNYNAALPSFIAAKILRKPVICIVHGVYGRRWTEMRGNFFGAASAFIERLQLNRGYDRIVFYSDFAREQGMEIGIRKGEVFYLGINPGEFVPKKKEKYVLFVGRLEKQKGIDILMQAAKELPDVKFKLVGKGDIERLKKSAPENIEFIGVKTGNELRELFSRAPVFCLPSVAETFGLVLLEAMSSGCAIVSTVPLDYKGEKIRHGDKEALKNAIRKLIDNPKLAERLGKENVKIAKKYDWEIFAGNLESLYFKLLKEKH